MIEFISGKCYALDENGSFTYNDCFTFTNNKYFSKQMYSEVMPYRMIHFYGFYLMQTLEEGWFRGRKDHNGNYEFDCMADSLEEILESL